MSSSKHRPVSLVLFFANLSVAGAAFAQAAGSGNGLPGNSPPPASTQVPPAQPYGAGNPAGGNSPADPRSGPGRTGGSMAPDAGTRDSGSSTVPARAETGVPPLFAQLDSDRDGQVSREEARRSADTTARFSEMDADRDSRISVAEWKAAEARRSGR